MTPPPCPECGVTMDYTPHRAGNCLNPDCVSCWLGLGEMSLVGIRKRLAVELDRGRSVLGVDAVAVPRVLLVRLVELLPAVAS